MTASVQVRMRRRARSARRKEAGCWCRVRPTRPTVVAANSGSGSSRSALSAQSASRRAEGIGLTELGQRSSGNGGARLYVNAVSRRALSRSASYSMTIAWSLAAATGAWRSSRTSGIAASDSTIISLKSSI